MSDKAFHLFFAATSLLAGALCHYIGAAPVAVICYCMAGGFFERAYPGGILS